jgi:hypothetical protein
VIHESPDNCDLWHDGCRCDEAIKFWQDLARRLAKFLDEEAIYPHHGEEGNRRVCDGCSLVAEAREAGLL